jgi:hypothetical protein
VKKAITEEREICDLCDRNNTAWLHCLSCKKAICYDCRNEGLAKEYPRAVYFGGSNDGLYCRDCDTRLITEGTDKLHRAYRRVEALRAESKAWNEDFQRRHTAVEKDIESYRSKTEGK